MATNTASPAHVDHHEGGHHEPPLKVYGRQRMAIWLFIAGDIITLSAMLFTYLYLRGVNSGNHWMSIVGLPVDKVHTYAYYENLANLPTQHLIHTSPLSPSFNWLVTAVGVVSALIFWAAERNLRKTKNRSAFTASSAVATLVAVLAAYLSVIQLQHIPQVYVAINDSHTLSYTAYSSVMMVLIGSTLVHFLLLAFLGLGMVIRSARGVLTGEKWYQAGLVRLFWVWVAISGVVVSALTTSVNVH
jgi:heme/copper-type cytochrome/quinol oxidase subunit 3